MGPAARLLAAAPAAPAAGGDGSGEDGGAGDALGTRGASAQEGPWDPEPRVGIPTVFPNVTEPLQVGAWNARGLASQKESATFVGLYSLEWTLGYACSWHTAG